MVGKREKRKGQDTDEREGERRRETVRKRGREDTNENS